MHHKLIDKLAASTLTAEKIAEIILEVETTEEAFETLTKVIRIRHSRRSVLPSTNADAHRLADSRKGSGRFWWDD